jgi:bidirectional [NiFe] hydrogenase diaphorase subunit
MNVCSLQIDGRALTVAADTSLMQAARRAGIAIPSLCHLDGLTPVGACRLCLVEVEGPQPGSQRPLAACVTAAAEGMRVHTDTPQLREIRRSIVEMLFSEGNHSCAVCIANGNCELQTMAVRVGMDHNRLPERFPRRAVDLSHPLFGIDHNRCILCTRCVRVCAEVEGAHVWDVGWRGEQCRIIAGLDQPWGAVDACSHCGKCVQVCPTGALFHKGDSCGDHPSHPERLTTLLHGRRQEMGLP